MAREKTPFVMIVEDDRDIAAFYRQVLDLAGYRTEIVTNGKAAVEHLYRNPPDIVLLDLLLPGTPGVEVLQKIHAAGIRVVIVTGNSQIVDSMPDIGDLVLYKPITPNQLSDFIGRQLQNDETLERHPFTKNPWDVTTGLYNRDFFVNRLECALENFRENPADLFAVMVVCLEQVEGEPDKTQRVKTIQGIANSLKTVTRPTDTLARFSLNHFYILVENLTDGKFLPTIVERVQQALDRHPIEGVRYKIQATLCNDSQVDMDAFLAGLRTTGSDD